MSSPELQKALIVDDEPVSRLGLSALLRDVPWIRVAGEAGNTREAIGMARALKPSLAILDIAISGDRGLEFIREVSDRCKILVFSLREETLFAERCIRAGAKGYLSKREPLETTRKAIETVGGGDVYLSDRVRERICNRMLSNSVQSYKEDIDLLSDREIEVFELLGQGASTKETAERLGVSAKTVQGYHIRIRERLDLPNFNKLIQRATYYVLTGK